MPHEHLALSYVLGALSAVERDALSRARLYDRSLDRAIAGFERRMAAPSSGGGTPAPPELWRAIVAALAAECTALAGKRAEAFSDGPWRTVSPGIEVKRLGDEDAWLLRCDPGPITPPRTMRTNDHLLIVAGDLCLGRRRFSTGDYLFSPADALDGLCSTDGCILLVLSGPA